MSRHASSEALVGLWIIFFVNGAVLSSWAPRIPEVTAELALSDTELGAALFGVAAGSVPALMLTAKALTVVRDTHLCIGAALLFGAGLPLVAVADDAAQLTGALVVLGAASGLLDVAMNTAGIGFQITSGRRVLSRLHGGYSLGVLAGAGGGVAATRLGASLGAHFVTTAAVLLALTLMAAPALVHPCSPSPVEPAADHPQPVGPTVRLPRPVALLAVSCLLVEGLVTDWSALLVTRDLGAHPAHGATALALFSLAMFLSRSCGDVLARWFTERQLLVTSAVAMPATVWIAVLAQSAVLMTAAITVTGLLLGPLFPMAVSRASRAHPEQAAALTARVSLFGYLAYLGGPPAVGIVAEALTLPVTFPLVVVLGSLGIGLAARNRPQRHPRRPPGPGHDGRGPPRPGTGVPGLARPTTFPREGAARVLRLLSDL